MSMVLPAMCYVTIILPTEIILRVVRLYIPGLLSLSSDGSFSLVFILLCLMTAGTMVSVKVDTSEAISILACSSLSTPFP